MVGQQPVYHKYKHDTLQLLSAVVMYGSVCAGTITHMGCDDTFVSTLIDQHLFDQQALHSSGSHSGASEPFRPFLNSAFA